MEEFDWAEFLNLAEELVERRGHLAAARSATSRAYYAAFHEASRYVAERGERLTQTGNDHVLVWNWFLRPGSSQRFKDIGANGRWLRRARRRADYDSRPFRDLSREARSAVTLSRQIVTELRRPA